MICRFFSMMIAPFIVLAFVAVSQAIFAEKAVTSAKLAALKPSATDWPCWRGPNHDGIAADDQKPPLKWNNDEHVAWKQAVPGRGHGSPIVFGDSVFLPTAEEDPAVQSVLCYDRRTGQQRWKTVVHAGGQSLEGLLSNQKSSLASSTMACDGERVFVNFLNGHAIYTTALDLTGKQLWQQKIDDYIRPQGFGSSPAIYGPLVIVSADNKGGGIIAALNRTDGKFAWKNDRPKLPNYTSPIILTAAGREQLVFTGCDLVSSFEPSTGKKIWEVVGATTECVTSTVTDGNLVYSTGGYPKRHVAAYRADGSGKMAWEKNLRVYVPSLLFKDGYIYAVLDAGVAECWKSDTGEKSWSNRINGNFTASPVLVGEHIFATSETGNTVIFKADPNTFELVGENQLGDEVLATPTFCGNKIYMRLAEHQDDKRQEWLYCLGE